MDKLILSGAGGGKKPPKQQPPVEAPNTLQSTAKGQILDLLAYGPIEGLVGGAKGVYLDDTRLQNDDNSYNFSGVTVEARYGELNQEVIPGFKSISNAREINAQILFDTPIVRTVLNSDADAVLITVRVPALVKSDVSSGNTNPHTLPFAVHVQNSSGTWNTGVADTISGKNTSPYERTYRVDLQGTGPFSIKVLRGNQESTVQTVQDSLIWAYLTEVVDVRQNYPGCALVGVTVDAKLFGNSIPSRKYLVELSVIKVPSNYNPRTGAYTGFWDGTFKEAWSDNPAWCFYDLATHPVIGAGIAEVNKWALYEIGKYCDELVPAGDGIHMEPRFTCNTLFASQEDAITALGTLASVFRGMLYWGAGGIEPVADMPGPLKQIISPADIIEGEFSYSGTSLKDRHSVAVVMWNDPEDGYVAKPEMVEDPESLELLGWRELRINAVACTSRGQARRVGLWALYSERRETETVTFQVAAKHYDLRPGDVIGVNDPYRAGARLGGKIVAVNGQVITLDAAPTEARAGWQVVLENDIGGMTQRNISAISGNTITVTGSVPSNIKVGGGFALSSSAVNSKLFRVVAVAEQEGSLFSVTAVVHYTSKYDEVELGLKNPDKPTSLIPSGKLSPPKNLTAVAYTYWAGGTSHQGLTIGWTAPADPRVERYILDVKDPDDVAFRTVYTEDGVSFDLKDAEGGEWRIRVRSVSKEWGTSGWVEIGSTVDSMLSPSAPYELAITTNSHSAYLTPLFNGASHEVEFWRSSAVIDNPEDIETSALYLSTGPNYLDSGLIWGTDYHYYVRAVNFYGKSEWVYGLGRTKSDVDEILEVILQEAQESQLGQWFQQEIDKISGIGPDSVNERIGAIDDRINGVVTDLEDTTEGLQGAVDAVDRKINELLNAPPYNPEVVYPKNSVVTENGVLYMAKRDLPKGIPLSDTTAWENIGDFEGLASGISALAARVQVNEVSLGNVNGVVTPMVSQLTSLRASLLGLQGGADSELDGAVRQWEAYSSFTEEVISRVNSYESLVSRLTSLQATFGSLNAQVQTLDIAVANSSEAYASQIAELKATMGDDISAAIATERTVRVTAEEALARDVAQLKATVGDDIQASIASESLTRATEDAALASSITSLRTQLSEDIHAAVTVERVARTNADSAFANQVNLLTATTNSKVTTFAQSSPPAGELTIGDIWYNTTTPENLPSRWNGTEWVSIDDIRLADLSAAVLVEQTARTDGDVALGQQISTVLATANEKNRTFQGATQPGSAGRIVGDIWYDGTNTPHRWNGVAWHKLLDGNIPLLQAQVAQETTARTDAVEALAQQVTTLQSTALAANKTWKQEAEPPLAGRTVGDVWYQVIPNTNGEVLLHRWDGTTWEGVSDYRSTLIVAGLQIEQATRASQDNALSQRITTAQASVNGMSASVQNLQSAQANTNGTLGAMWGVKMQVNNRGQYVVAGVGLGVENYGGVLQSHFIVQADRFTVINGVNGIDTVPFAIKNNQVIIKNALIDDLRSSNYVAGSTGWRLDKSGSFEINSQFVGGGRVSIDSKGMRVFDQSGKLRVKIGDLR